MTSQQSNFRASGYNTENPNVVNTGANVPAYTLTGNQPQQVFSNVAGGSRAQTNQVYGETIQQVRQVYRTQNYTSSSNAQRNYVGTSDNYGYGYSTNAYQGSGVGKQVGFGTATSVGPYGVYQPVNSTSNQATSGNVYGTSGTGQVVVNPTTNVNFGRGSRAQGVSTGQPVNFVPSGQPATTQFVQPAATFTQPPVQTSVVQPQPAQWVQPSTVYNPPQIGASYVPVQTGANQLVEQQFQRPKYPKLYNNTAEYYRNLAPEDDPAIKKTCCSPCCWVLWGLLGLLAALFGILCGLGIICPGFGFPAGTAIGVAPSPVTPTPQPQPVTPEPTPVGPVIPHGDNFIHPSTTDKVPIYTTTQTTSSWVTPSSTGVYVPPTTTPTTTTPTTGNTYVQPTFESNVPADTSVPTSTYSLSYPVTSPTSTYSDSTSGYNSGYAPTNQPYSNSYPATNTDNSFDPTFAQPTADYSTPVY